MEKVKQAPQQETLAGDLLEQITANTPEQPVTLNPLHTYLAAIAYIDEDNRLWVIIPQHEHLLEASTITPVCDDDIGRICTVSFIEANTKQPLVTGLLQQPNQVADKIKLKATEEVMLECGNSQVSLDSHGRVKIRGESISSRSYGANRVKGGSVKLN